MKKKHLHVKAQQDILPSRRLPGNMHSRNMRALPLRSLATIASFVFFLLVPAALYSYWQTIGYALRPIWDTPPKPFHHIAHYYADNVSIATLCSVHGWTIRLHPRRVYDAVIFNNELDLLELRWRELASVITKFVILESNTTFTGQGKPLWFAENMQRFAFAESQMVYAEMGGRNLVRGEKPFVLEYAQRVHMDKVLQGAGIAQGDLLIIADVDEIPSAHTIHLLRWCDGIPDVMHLQMNTYLYSFEFLMDKDTWRPSVHVYAPGKTEYDHGRQTDLILADAGWHCSFCFRHVEDIAFKMLAYSHADRVKSRAFLDPQRIQAIVCKGADLFDMLPEAYSFKELIMKSGVAPRSYSGVNLPSFLLRHHERFKFLLPGHCMRYR
ncbi:hypothetical protein L7F22_065099 [Adiantum nelumboides]|nr:hypothetical protein [Adiantum nelumboides]